MARPGICLVILLAINVLKPSFLSAQYLLPPQGKSTIHPKTVLKVLRLDSKDDLREIRKQIIQYRSTLLQTYEQQLNETLVELNRLRDAQYQNKVGIAARQLEGRNIYHDYAYGNKNDDTNTCVNGWCQVVNATGLAQFEDLAEGHIYLYPATFEEERFKKNPNLWQKIPKYINVSDLLADIESYGFLAIDLDLAQRGDLCVQYYRKQRLKDEFTAQHISLIDRIVLWKDGVFELRDWHEGIEDLPFVYRTGRNMESSFNNIFRPENVYYGFQEETGQERTLIGKNPNVCQAYGYFGRNAILAKPLIKQINFLRKQMDMIQQIDADFLVQLEMELLAGQ